jgi:uncharacterized protein YbjT (DUF2867 family)
MADGDLLAGDGLAGAAAGVGAVVHCGSDPRRPCVEVDGTRNLIQAVQAAGTPHLVYVSIVGIDRVPYRYYRAKLEAERLIQASGCRGRSCAPPSSTQLILLVAEDLARLPMVPVPAATNFQPVDAGEVAERLAGLAAGPPAGRAPEVGGPQVRTAPACCAPTCMRHGGSGQSCRSGCPARCSPNTGAGGHLAPGHASGAVPGNSSWPNG